jgi:hypothetical protein
MIGIARPCKKRWAVNIIYRHNHALYLLIIINIIFYFDCISQQCPVRFLQGEKTGTGVMGGPIFLN